MKGLLQANWQKVQWPKFFHEYLILRTIWKVSELSTNMAHHIPIAESTVVEPRQLDTLLSQLYYDAILYGRHKIHKRQLLHDAL